MTACLRGVEGWVESISVEQFAPQLVCQVMDEEFGTLGYLVIDRTVGRHASGGGIRQAAGLSVAEIAQLARAMTLKFAFLNFPVGGAKAGITVPEPLISERRKDVFAAFGRAIGILIQNRVYFTGEDLGTTMDDINEIQRVLGRPLYRSSDDAIQLTALTVFEVIRQSVQHRRLPFSALAVAIGGFGKVGSELARLLAGMGARIVAVSTDRGALYNPSGLDVAHMLALRAQHGDAFVGFYARAEKIPNEGLLELDVDLLVPCARTWAIHEGNAEQVQARIIVPAANGPLTPGAERALLERGVLYMPDFIANSGAILGSRMQSSGFGPGQARQLIESIFADKIARLLQVADELQSPPVTLARAIAWRNFHAQNAAAASHKHAGAAGTLRRVGRNLRRLVPGESERRARLRLSEFAQRFVGEIAPVDVTTDGAGAGMPVTGHRYS
jgi:glutamate dehydrogenase (NAD(P)+)